LQLFFSKNCYSIDSLDFYHNQHTFYLKKYNYKKAVQYTHLEKNYKLKQQPKASLFNEYMQLGGIYKTFSIYDSALVYFSKAETELKIEDKSSKRALVLLQKGRIYKNRLNFNKSLQSLRQSLVIYEHLQDTIQSGVVYLNIGNVFKSLNKYNEAVQNYHKALVKFTITDQTPLQASCFNNLGNLYRQTKQIDSSFFYLYKTLSIREKGNNIQYKSFVYHNLSNLHSDKGNIDSALFYINKSLQLKHVMNNKSEIYMDYISLGDIHKKNRDYKNALYYYEEAFKSATYQNDIESSTDISKELADIYYNTKSYKKSATNYRIYNFYKDSLDKSKSILKVEQELINFEFIKDSLARQQLVLSKEVSEIEKSNLELTDKVNSNNKNYLIIIACILAIFSGLLYFSFKKRLKASNQYKSTLEARNNELKRTLISKEEKETLLKEVHHRVKNNLQIINSLIRLQSHYMTEKNYTQKLEDTENRIRSMALVHEKLYKSDDLSKLDAKSYINELVENILASTEMTVPLKYSPQICDAKFSIDTLIPLGLIINEIISNSVKYAFTGLESGELFIKLTQAKNLKTKLTISDNGIGADLNYKELSEDSLGMELIQSLVEQLDGNLTLETENGFEYILEFNKLV